jgi:hypothetical protein
VRGLFASCEWHTGSKLSMPHLVKTASLFPVIMWPNSKRVELVGNAPVTLELEIDGAVSLPNTGTKRTALDTFMAWLAVVSLAVAVASFIHDLLSA